jgi:short-subunit dehydrogenase
MEQDEVKYYTLITGASNGIGKGFAYACARRGQNVLLVALPDQDLEQTLADLRIAHPECCFDALGIDLSLGESPKEVFNWCQEKGYRVDVLVNNVGVGNAGPFLSRPADFYYAQIHLNMVSTVMLTHLFLPELQRHAKAYILNVSSLAAFYDIPYKSTYSASKKFVYSFSQSLRKELESTNISITVLCPGGVITNSDVAQREKDLGRMARWTLKSIEEVAEYALDHLFKGKAVAIPGTFPKIYRLVGKLVPYPIQLNMLANAFVRSNK